MPNHSLMRRRIPITSRLRPIHKRPHFLELLLREFNIPGRPVPLKPLRLRRPRNRNHALGSNPRQRDLRNTTALFRSEGLDFFDDCAVLVEVFALEFGAFFSC